MKRKRDYLEIGEINHILDDRLNVINHEMDMAVLDDDLDSLKLNRLVTERITVKRIKSIFENHLNDQGE